MTDTPNENATPGQEGGADQNNISSGNNTPVAVEVVDAVPAQMRTARRWLLWKFIPNKDPAKKPRKVPYYVSGTERQGEQNGPADVANMATLEDAVKACVRPYSGIGFALGPDGTGNYWQGIDFDKLADHPELQILIDDGLPGYTETSPSGNGFHAIGYGRQFPHLTSNPTGIEAFSTSQFFTVTGDNAGMGEPVDLADYVRTVLAPMHGRAKQSANTQHPASKQGAAAESVTPAQVAELRSALAILDADDRSEWVANGQRLKNLGNIGRGLWLEWSQSSDKYDAADAAHIWDSFTADRTGYKAVFKAAQDAGWVNPASRASTGADDDTGGAHDPCTHLANAHRLVSHFGNRLLFVEGIGWHTWSPPWRPDELGARRIAQGLGKMIATEAAALAPWVAEAKDIREREEREGVMRARFKWASQSENAMNVELSLKMAQPLLSCKADEMDGKPGLLGLPGGVLDLRTGEHREHRQADRLTRVAGCDYNPGATCPTWTRFLGEIMGGDAELLDYLQRLCGYALSGMRGEHLLPIFYGSGANGKSTLLAAMQNVLGDYAGTAAPGLLIARGGNEHPTGLADLQGRRLVVVSETGETGRLNEEQVKALTGGDRITARRMRMDFYQFNPSHLLVLQTNHKPRVTGTDEGIWRRVRLIPFVVTIPPSKRDARLPEKLQAELPGILSWAVEGWRKYQAAGFITPAAVTAATSEYRDASDQIGAFVAESCEVGDRYTATAAELYKTYSVWCEEAGERPRTQREFGMRLSERGFEQVRTGSSRRWRGLSVSGPAAFSDGSDGSDGGFGLTASKSSSHKGYSQSSVTSVTSVTTAADYLAAKDGGL